MGVSVLSLHIESTDSMIVISDTRKKQGYLQCMRQSTGHGTITCRAGGDGGAGRAFALPLFGGPYRK